MLQSNAQINKSFPVWISVIMYISGVASSPPKRLLCPAIEIENDCDTLIEQSNILIKQSVDQVMHYQCTESSFFTANCYIGTY